jgi:hypothetical protein
MATRGRPDTPGVLERSAAAEKVRPPLVDCAIQMSGAFGSFEVSSQTATRTPPAATMAGWL